MGVRNFIGYKQTTFCLGGKTKVADFAGTTNLFNSIMHYNL